MKTEIQSQPIDAKKIGMLQLAYVESALKDAVKPVVRDIKNNITSNGLRTGALKTAIKSKVAMRKKDYSGVYGLVGVDKAVISYDRYGNKVRPSKYAHLVEFGTKRTAGKFFITKAALKNQIQIQQAINNALKKANDAL